MKWGNRYYKLGHVLQNRATSLQNGRAIKERGVIFMFFLFFSLIFLQTLNLICRRFFWPFQNNNGIEAVFHPNSSAMHSAFSYRSIHKSLDFWLSLKTMQCFMMQKCILTDSLIELVIEPSSSVQNISPPAQKASNKQGGCQGKNRKKNWKKSDFFRVFFECSCIFKVKRFFFF